ncbi:ATP-grasp domain-containing protein [Corallococcus sp. RDP092CA]|uniref:ATP-grasp domain-containing protein n=1 Tax=Corallococcus sp. RDP092CA TaxID=3109369 RepID=UPI0035B3628C
MSQSKAKRILIVGGGAEGLDVLEKAHALGLNVVCINKKKHFREAFLPYVEHVVLTDYEHVENLVAIARGLHQLFPLDGVISLTEASLLPTAYVCEALGLRGNTVESVRRLKDKVSMRRRLDEVGLSPVVARVGERIEDIHAFVAEHGLPFVMKPTDAAGSLGIFKIFKPSQIAPAWEAFQQLALPRFLLEEFLDGPEISVETLSFHGRHVMVTATDKLITEDTCVEIGHAVPAPLDAGTREEVYALVRAFLDAMGLKEGPAHTELKLTKKGPRIVEGHNRNPGGRVTELVTLACGVDIKSTALAWACGMGEPLAELPAPKGGAAIRHVQPIPGTVREISGIEALKQEEGFVDVRVLVKVGGRVNPMRSGEDRIGHVIARGATVQEAILRGEQLASRVRITTEPERVVAA